MENAGYLKINSSILATSSLVKSFIKVTALNLEKYLSLSTFLILFSKSVRVIPTKLQKPKVSKIGFLVSGSSFIEALV